MKKIYLSGTKGKGKYALVDNEDYKTLSQYKWFLNRIYAVRNTSRLEGHKMIYMHKNIVNYSIVDHINGNGLDNRRKNLRLSTIRLNAYNQGIASNNTSGYKGVSVFKRGNQYMAKLMHKGKRLYLGLYDNPLDAALAYNKKAKELYGEYARLNQI